MRFYDSLGAVPADFGPSAVTFGKFDGIHVGHQRIVDRLLAVAAERGLTSTVLTFDRNPLSVLDPARSPESVISNAQKRDLLAAAAVDAMLELPFDREFSTHTAEDFVDDVIVGALHAKVVLVGPDTRFGRGGTGDFDGLVAFGADRGFEVQRLPLSVDESGDTVSSTRIRSLLAAGDVSNAARLLGRRPSVRAVVVHGQERGRALGFPTANLAPDLEGFIPADGIYAGYVLLDGQRMPAAISIGNNPTFEGVPARQVEAHILDADLDLYGRVVVVEFVEYIRGQVKYEDLDTLIAQIRQDTVGVRAVLAAVAA
jgi:riboflavin kinase/FMN adenylyltransferase